MSDNVLRDVYEVKATLVMFKDCHTEIPEGDIRISDVTALLSSHDGPNKRFIFIVFQ